MLNIYIIVIKKQFADDSVKQMIMSAKRIAVDDDHICVCAIDCSDSFCSEISNVGIDEILIYTTSAKGMLYLEQTIEILHDLWKCRKIGLIFMENNSYGIACSVRLALLTNGEAIIDCIGIERTQNGFAAIKPIFSSKIRAKININNRCCIMTLRNNSSVEIERHKKTTFIRESLIVKNVPWVLEDKEMSKSDSSLEDAERVVIAGRGIKNSDDLKLVENFANSINAMLAGTRPLIYSGLLPAERQVGQSGTIIAPRLCIVIGASGASPLIEGIKNAKTIIAINKDRDARIFKLADYGIVSDFREVFKNR